MTSSSWSEHKLGDLIQINPDALNKTYPYSEIEYLDISSVGTGFYTEVRRLKLEEAPSRAKRLVSDGDTIISTVRPGNKSYCYLKKTTPRMVVSTGFAVLRAKKDLLDERFLYYLVSNPAFTEYLVAHEKGAAYPAVGTETIENAIVNIPDLPTQKKISEILGSIDDKIELNRRMNETLEQMAMALYKYWFVDFGPFQDGESDIPQGWEYSPIEKLISEIESGDWGADKWTEKTPHQVICIRGTDIPQVRTGNDVKAPLRFIKQKSFEKKTLKPGDIVLEASGGSPSQSTGRPVLITKGIISRFNVPLTCSNFCKIIRPSSKNFSYYLYLHFMDSYEQNVFFSYENGTTGIKNLDINSYIKQNYIAIPPINIIDEFNQAVEDLFEQIQRNAIETDYLKETRDYLLPRLLSGEIEVREAEEQVEEVLANA